MPDTHPHAFSYPDLDRLVPEVLPARLLLSTAAPLAGGDDGTTTVVYSCQAISSPGNAGLLGTGLLAQAPYSSLTCVPGTVVQQH